MRRISWLAERLLASQEGFCSLEFHSYTHSHSQWTRVQFQIPPADFATYETCCCCYLYSSHCTINTKIKTHKIGVIRLLQDARAIGPWSTDRLESSRLLDHIPVNRTMFLFDRESTMPWLHYKMWLQRLKRVVSPEPKHHASKKYKSGGKVPYNLNFDTKWGSVVRFILRLFYPRGKRPCYRLNRRLGGPQNCSGRGNNSVVICLLASWKMYTVNVSLLIMHLNYLFDGTWTGNNDARAAENRWCVGSSSR